jgi:hypothetical protein
MQTALRVFNDVKAHSALRLSRPERALFGFDAPGERLRPQAARIAPLTRNHPESQRLAKSARSRQASYPAYVAAHLMLHDMVDSVIAEPETEERPDLSARRIISIGALSERSFYAARMRCRSAPYFVTDDMVVATGQIFTKHVLPPYNFSRQPGTARPEPSLSRPQATCTNLSEVTERERQVIRLDHPNRDLAYLRDYLRHYAPEQDYPPPPPLTARQCYTGNTDVHAAIDTIPTQ